MLWYFMKRKKKPLLRRVDNEIRLENENSVLFNLFWWHEYGTVKEEFR